MWDKLIQGVVRGLERISPRVEDAGPKHIKTGRVGEEAAYFYLRDRGYVVVARNWRVPSIKGEVDLIAWDRDVLCFVEVKTRSSREVKPAEAAVDDAKRKMLRAMARRFLRRRKPQPPYRFDVLSIYVSKDRAIEFELFQNAFSLT